MRTSFTQLRDTAHRWRTALQLLAGSQALYEWATQAHATTMLGALACRPFAADRLLHLLLAGVSDNTLLVINP